MVIYVLDDTLPGQIHVAYELFSNALHMFLQVYGPMHLDIANCYR